MKRIHRYSSIEALAVLTNGHKPGEKQDAIESLRLRGQLSLPDVREVLLQILRHEHDSLELRVDTIFALAEDSVADSAVQKTFQQVLEEDPAGEVQAAVEQALSEAEYRDFS